MTEPNWRVAEGLDPATTRFPTAAKVGEDRVVIFHTGKGYRGVELRCPHQQAAMTNGIVMHDGTMVRCPKHNFIFRLSDGKGVNCVGLNLKVYDVRSNEGHLDVLIA
jgi:nitrite reductase/ring-hydroxylating ferredoxin subunit